MIVANGWLSGLLLYIITKFENRSSLCSIAKIALFNSEAPNDIYQSVLYLNIVFYIVILYVYVGRVSNHPNKLENSNHLNGCTHTMLIILSLIAICTIILQFHIRYRFEYYGLTIHICMFGG